MIRLLGNVIMVMIQKILIQVLQLPAPKVFYINIHFDKKSIKHIYKLYRNRICNNIKKSELKWIMFKPKLCNCVFFKFQVPPKINTVLTCDKNLYKKTYWYALENI